MECRYGECDNQSRITLECDTAYWSVIGPEPQRETPVDIANKSIYMLECIIHMRQTSEETLSRISTLAQAGYQPSGGPTGPALRLILPA